MRVRDVMASPVVTVAPGAALKEVASLLVERRINAVPVVDAGDRLIGIVSEADLLSLETGQAAAAGGAPPHSAGEVMRQSVYTLTGDTDATAAARLMLRHRLKSVPVVDGDRVVGMVTRRDLLRLIARSDEDIRADLERRVAQERGGPAPGRRRGPRRRGHRRRRRPLPPAGRAAGPHRPRRGRGPLAPARPRSVTADHIRACRNARELVADMHWRGLSVPPLYARMAGEFQDLVASGDYAAWLATGALPGPPPSRPGRRAQPFLARARPGQGPIGKVAGGDDPAGQRGRPSRRVSTDLAIRRRRVSSVLAPVTWRTCQDLLL